MAMRTKTTFQCGECGASAPRWQGRCGGCGAWNTLSQVGGGSAAQPMPICDVARDGWSARPTGVGELDRVLGGGVVPGSVTLVGGEPGIGKSTLVLQAMGTLAAAGRRCLLVSAEESAQQVRERAERVGALRPKLWLLSETSLPSILAAIDELKPDVVAVDSIQTVQDPAVDGVPGSVAQVRECARALIDVAKRRDLAFLLVGHVTKEGTLAGPKVLEHLVDTVLSFEGDRHHALRMLRAAKHRFGSTEEVGLFELGESGLAGVPDPSGLFLGDARAGTPGSVVVPVMEGHRPLLVELQALVVADARAPGAPIPPRRSAQGLDQRRLALLLAVLQQRLKYPVGTADVYVSAVGGVRVNEPGADLALALAIVSASRGVVVPTGVVACGEVGLGGEVRQVAHLERRLRESARLGFVRAVVPFHAPEAPAGLEVVRVATLREAIEAFVDHGGSIDSRGDLA